MLHYIMDFFVRNVPQIVPESRCAACRVCCRFPDPEKAQLPAWSKLEADWVRGRPGGSEWFRPVPDSPSLLPRPVACGSEGYRCPAFDPVSSRCTIHADKPLDCRLYPFGVAHNPGQTEAVLVMDMKCPYLQEHAEDPALADYAVRLAEYLSRPEGTAYLSMNPKLIGPFWPEYRSVAALPHATAQMHPLRSVRPPHPLLEPLGAEQIKELRKAWRDWPPRSSLSTLASLLGWQDLFSFWWMKRDKVRAVFAEQAGALFLPIPPVGEGSMDPAVLQEIWNVLAEANSGGSVSRVEGIETAAAPAWESAGFRLMPGEIEYLYHREDLARLRGDRYRSQRGSINRLLKRGAPDLEIRPFERRDVVPCLQLYTRWAIHKQGRSAEFPYERALVRDGLFFHRRLMMDSEALGLTGWVAESRGRIVGYTLGGAISQGVFGVFLEIGDPALPGIPQLLFREFCRRETGYPVINVMGDSGLEGLRQAKEGYRPAEKLQLYTAVGRKEWS